MGKFEPLPRDRTKKDEIGRIFCLTNGVKCIILKMVVLLYSPPFGDIVQDEHI